MTSRRAARNTRWHALRRKPWFWALVGVVGLPLLLALGFSLTARLYPFPTERLSEDIGAPLVIVDRRGEVLRAVPAKSKHGRPGRSALMPLSALRPVAVSALITSEDHTFFSHAGVSVRGVVRSAWLNLRSGRANYGGSTITMQLARMLFSEGQPRTLANKVKEMFWALSMERALDKHQILEAYLNRAYYANGAFGMEAAAQTYFNRPAAALSAAETLLLVVIPRSPGAYDPLRHLDRTLARRDRVLSLMQSRGLISAGEAQRIVRDPVEVSLHRPPFLAPHFCDYVLSQLTAAQRQQGGTVHTTLDGHLQRDLEYNVAEHVRRMRSRGLAEAGAVVLDTQTGAVLAMVGSPNFRGPAGQLNITTHRRHPGSALKPFVFAAALERGDTPATLALDIHDVPNSRYRAARLSQPERGPVRYREALAGSYNLAAVHVLESVGEEVLITLLRRGGIGAVPGGPDDYGPRLALGATRVTLLDLAAGYGFMATGGWVHRPFGIVKISGPKRADWQPPAPVPVRLFSETTSWLIGDILADDNARIPAFGRELAVTELPFRAAFKTGTARGFADTVTVGVTAQVIAAAWGGNFSGRATQGVLGMDGAAPVVRAALQLVARERELSLPPPPEGIVSLSICPLSGMQAGPHCPNTKLEHFDARHAPQQTCDWHVHQNGRVHLAVPEAFAHFF